MVEGFTFLIGTRDPSGTLISSFPTAANSVSVAVAQDGTYLVGQLPARVQRFSPSGTLLQTIGTADFIGAGVFGVAVDPTTGLIYANDTTSGADQVLLFNPDGTFNSIFATGIAQPQGLAVDAGRNVYVGQTISGARVHIFDSLGVPIATIGPDPLLLTNPRGIAVDSQNRIIVADGPVVKIFSPAVAPPPTSGKVDVCHRNNGKNNPDKTINIASDSVAGHLAHGDTLGACES